MSKMKCASLKMPKMDCASLKKKWILYIHENGLLKNGIKGELPFPLMEEFHSKRTCCFFSNGKKLSIKSIKEHCLSLIETPNHVYWNMWYFQPLIWFISEFVNDMCLEAVKNGHLECFMFSLTNGLFRMGLVLKDERLINDFEFDMLVRNFEVFKMVELLKEACRRGHVEILLWMVKIGYPSDIVFLDEAAKNGYLNILTCPELTKGITLNYELIITSAAANGFIHVLEYCFAHWKNRIASFMKQSFKAAVENRKPQSLLFLFPHTKEHFNEKVWLEIASFPESAKLIQLGLDNQMVMPDKIWEIAAERGNVGVVKIAIERNIPIDKSVWKRAALFNHAKVLECLLSVNEIDLEYDSILISAVVNFDEDVLRFCVDQWKDEITPFLQPVVKTILEDQYRRFPDLRMASLEVLFPHAKEHFTEEVWMKIGVSCWNNQDLIQLGIDSGVVMTDAFWEKARITNCNWSCHCPDMWPAAKQALMSKNGLKGGVEVK